MTSLPRVRTHRAATTFIETDVTRRVQLEGRVVFVRQPHARVQLVDVECASVEHGVALVLKGDVLDAAHQVALGDRVDVTAHPQRLVDEQGREVQREGAVTPQPFMCVSLRVCEAWDPDAAQGAFVARPLARVDGKQKETPCKFDLGASCALGNGCPFLHVDRSTAEGKLAWMRWSRERHTLREQAHDRMTAHDGIAAHEKQHHDERASVFCTWLLDTFGEARLTAGSGVLDVAGGRGDVSFELFTKRAIPCTVIDPRPVRLRKHQLKWLRTSTATAPSTPGDRVAPQHQTFFDEAWCEAHAETLEGVSVLVGMHPDEATEMIVDVAVEHGKPFAVVPCCVFPRAGGSMSSERWVDFLQSKSPDIQRTHLKFKGKNCVLFRV